MWIMKKKVLCSAVLFLSFIAVAAAQDVLVLALFKDKAVLRIDGIQRTLRVGEASPEGVRLISADSAQAVLEINGRRGTHALGSHTSYATVGPATRSTVQIWRNTGGMYTTGGSINGVPVVFLVDTGASVIAMNSQDARRFGIDYRRAGAVGMVSTASGVERAYQVSLDSVKVGNILLRNVEAAVLEGPHPPVVLLGMSFLGRVEMENQGSMLVLRQKY